MLVGTSRLQVLHRAQTWVHGRLETKPRELTCTVLLQVLSSLPSLPSRFHLSDSFYNCLLNSFQSIYLYLEERSKKSESSGHLLVGDFLMYSILYFLMFETLCIFSEN